MDARLFSFFKTPQGIQKVQIFAYANKGLPGLEINGAGKFSRNIKEKMIYLSRIRKLKIPGKRYVICIEQDEGIEIGHNSKWLEFPIFIIYLYLAEILKLSKLDDCICAGQINPNGEVILPEFSIELLNHSIKYIGISDGFNHVIDPRGLLKDIPLLKFKTNQIESSSAVPTKSFIA